MNSHSLPVISTLLLIALANTGCMSVYSYESVSATVVDAQTKAPLQDVIVIAHWKLEAGSIGGVKTVGTAKVMETVTDNKGRFHFPAWGPNVSFKGTLSSWGAQLSLFKPGYLPGYGENHSPLWHVEHPGISQWEGKTFELIKYPVYDLKYAKRIEFLDSELDYIRYGDHCEWTQIPRMLVALHKMHEYFEAHGITEEGWLPGAGVRKITDVTKRGNCGEPRQLFRKYMQ